jgi:hypothetical protein
MKVLQRTSRRRVRDESKRERERERERIDQARAVDSCNTPEPAHKEQRMHSCAVCTPSTPVMPPNLQARERKRKRGREKGERESTIVIGTSI